MTDGKYLLWTVSFDSTMKLLDAEIDHIRDVRLVAHLISHSMHLRFSPLEPERFDMVDPHGKAAADASFLLFAKVMALSLKQVDLRKRGFEWSPRMAGWPISS